MISISGKIWEESKIDKNKIEKIKQDFNLSEIVSKIIIRRKFTEEEIYSLNNKIEISNIFINNKDYKNSVDILIKSIENKEIICILGDYDVDGSVATSFIVRFLNEIKHPNFFYIPDRQTDGYGATKKLFLKLIKKKPKLVIMVDCGSTSIEAIEFLNNNNIKSIIIDHHEISKPYPLATSIINPKKNNGYNEYNYMCATTLTYFFIELVKKKIKSKINLKDYLIYVLLATVCDVMPIRKYNRLIAIEALKKIDISNLKALNEICEIKKIKNKISINDLGYLIGPILNAGGRLGKSNYATELLSSVDNRFIKKRSNELIILNEKRKIIENNILKDIDFNKIEKKNDSIIIINNYNINEGLIGIIAARLKEHFNKPSIVITDSNNLLKGSARSTPNFNIGSIIKNALDKKIIINGGGHNMAAGFTLKKDMLDSFKKFLNISYKKNINKDSDIFYYEAKLSSIAINKKFYDEIKILSPFGNENIEPIFLFESLKIIKSEIINNKHISCILKSKIGYSIKSICFNAVKTNLEKYLLNYKKELNVIGQIKQNIWNNKNTLQLTIKDLII